MSKYEIKGFIRGTMKLLEKQEEEVKQHHSELRRELTGTEYQDYGFLMGRLFTCQAMLTLLEGLDD